MSSPDVLEHTLSWAEATYISSAAPGQSPSTQRARSRTISGRCNSRRQEGELSPVIRAPAKALSLVTVPGTPAAHPPRQGHIVPLAVRRPGARYAHSMARPFQHTRPFLPARFWALSCGPCRPAFGTSLLPGLPGSGRDMSQLRATEGHQVRICGGEG